MDRCSNSCESSQRRRRHRRETVRRDKVSRKKINAREKVEKSQHTAFFPIFCGPGGSKSRLAQAAGAEPSGGIGDQNAVVARNTFRSQNVQNTSASDRFWNLSCQTSAVGCGAKRIWKPKCQKHLGFRPLFGRWQLEKVHGAMAKRILKSESLTAPRCLRGHGAKHIWKSKC